ncbi:MAG: phage tail tape measure protein, partial [Lactococcus lactis]|nr:phage tail tape measure protein [Lactococcus lactis]MDN6821691.1 phage tail tape measure protein [Lactococcus lactis]
IIIVNLPTIIQAAIKIILAIVDGIAQALPALTPAIVQVILMIVKTIINNLPSIIIAAIQILVAVASGILQAIPKATGAINNMINALLRYIASSIGDFLSKGGQIIGSFVNGIISGKNPVDVFKNFIKDIAGLFGLDTLYEQGSAIISGFFNGLKDKFEGVKKWVGGIGDWIAKHKGPLPYDRRLLIPHGGAIMAGLDEGLQDKFKTVQANVSSMANKLANSFTGGLPSLDATLNTTGLSAESYKEKSNDGSKSGQRVVNQYITVQAKWNGKGDIQQTMEQMYTKTIQDQRGEL